MRVGGLPWWLSGKESTCLWRRYKRHSLDPWVWKIPWRRKWQPTPVLLPGKSHGERSMAGYSPWGYKELDRLKQLSTYSYLLSQLNISNVNNQVKIIYQYRHGKIISKIVSPFLHVQTEYAKPFQELYSQHRHQRRRILCSTVFSSVPSNQSNAYKKEEDSNYRYRYCVFILK